MSKKRVYLSQDEWAMYKAKEDIIPAIVSEELWEKCNKLINERSSKNSKSGSSYMSIYKYSRLIYCKHDGALYWRGKYRQYSKDEFWQCSQYKTKGKAGCSNNVTILKKELDGIMEQIFSDIIKYKPNIVKELTSRIYDIYSNCDNEKIDIEKLQIELNNIKNEKKNLIKLYTMNKIEASEFEELNNDYKGQIDEIQAKMDDINNKDLKSEMENNVKKIKNYFEYNFGFKYEIPEEFIREKVSRIYVEKINDDFVRLYVCLNLGLDISDEEKNCIRLGLTM